MEYSITLTGKGPVLPKVMALLFQTAVVKRSLKVVETFQREQVGSILK